MTSWKLLSARLPVVLQAEVTECGLACLTMVARFHGHDTDLAALRKRFAVSRRGASLDVLMRMARALDLEAAPLRVEMEELSDLQLPCLLHWDLCHFVVLASIGRHHAVIHDPASGIIRMTLDEVAEHFTGVALELRAEATFTPLADAQAVGIGRLIGQVSGLKTALLQLLLLGVVLETVVVLLPFQLQWAVDQALVSADRQLLTALGVGFVGLVLMQALVNAARGWLIAALGVSMNFQWLGNVFSHLLRLPMAFFEKRHLGHIMSCFGAVSEIQRTLTTSLVQVVLDGVLAAGTLMMMFMYSPALAAISLLPVLAYLLLRALLYRAQHAAAAREIAHQARQETHFLETATGIQAVKLFGRAEERRVGWLNMAAHQFRARLAGQRLNVAAQSTEALLFGIERVVVIWLAALQVLDQRFTVGMLFAYLAYREQFALRIGGLVGKVFEIRMLRVHCERLADIALTPAENDKADEIDVGYLEASIELKEVSFRYAPSEPDVLRNLRLRIEPGECIAIAGPSGGGKTTLVKLILGVLNPSEGEVWIGGRPLDRMGLSNYRRLIGTVMQDDRLFSGSIADNICFFDPAPDSVRIEACARQAAIHDDLVEMHMGYETLVGDHGSGLSGGQVQRVLLARALYKQPRILVLDEATAHLDAETEQRVNEAVRELKLTRIIVAHRRETIEMADRVIIIDDGRIACDTSRLGAPPTQNRLTA
jgi:ATP-binding cassette subfamily B protein RaxB